MMKVSVMDSCRAFSAVTVTKNKITFYVVLNPSLIEVVQSSDISPFDAFIEVVEQIKVFAPMEKLLESTIMRYTHINHAYSSNTNY